MKIDAVLFLTLALLLSGCSLLNKPPDEPAIVIGELGASNLLPDGSAGIITCSDRCEIKSQCGTADGNKVIMGGVNTPVVSSWDMMLADKTAVIINFSEERTVQKIIDPSQEEKLRFYNVTASDGSNKSGWIAGWCVATTTQPQPATE